MLWLFQRAILQKSENDVSLMQDLNFKEIIAFLPIVLLIFTMGLYPEMFLYKIEPTIHHYLKDILLLGGN
jgi:NADH-quinone oxidoreductase subunit M